MARGSSRARPTSYDAVESNLQHLGLDRLAVVNFRAMLGGSRAGPVDGSIAAPIEALAKLQQEGLIEHLGVSNVTADQVAEARAVAPIVCVQNQFNIAHRNDDALIDSLAADGIAYVPFFPLGGLSSVQSSQLGTVARGLDAAPLQIALAWLLQRAPNILLIPGTSSIGHLRENLAAATFSLPDTTMTVLDGIARQAE
jgi:pyridoxine 4-dehydrogenase